MEQQQLSGHEEGCCVAHVLLIESLRHIAAALTIKVGSNEDDVRLTPELGLRFTIIMIMLEYLVTVQLFTTHLIELCNGQDTAL